MFDIPGSCVFREKIQDIGIRITSSKSLLLATRYTSSHGISKQRVGADIKTKNLRICELSE